MSFIHDDFLLKTDMARRLYHEVAAALPIIDYHCHLPPLDIATNRQFKNLFEIWLEGDHYKWRAMRANGVDEEYCTGNADPYDKFLAWAKTVPHTLRNPLYHWTHLELKRYFEIDELLNEDSAPAIWETAKRRLCEPDRSVHGILADFHVECLCTTDDPIDDLAAHREIASGDLATRVTPAFRPDKLLKTEDAEAFNAYLVAFAAAADTDVSTYAGLEEAFRKRHDTFHENGCRLSDHGLNVTPATFASEQAVAAVYDKARAGKTLTPEEHDAYSTSIMLLSGRLDAEKGWVKQLHLGAMRNNSTRLFDSLGPDTGLDSMGDWPQAERLSRYLDRLDQDNLLPKTIVYNNNPVDNYPFAAMIGNFQDGSVAGKIQFGSAWWFLDQREGMTLQMNALSNTGLLSRFVGMLTDSRSFMSYPRHEYFRRLLCDLLGDDVERGELPDAFDLLARMVRDISHDNAARYFDF
jgi:glucuronate isomerase